jgi:hypothetical protein
MALVYIPANAQYKPNLIVSIDSSPTDYQVFQRDSVNKCSVTIKGKYYGKQNLFLARKNRYRYLEQYYTISSIPINVDSDSTFEITVRIGAELREWSFGIKAGEELIAEFKHLICGDVYVVTGQSNATSTLGDVRGSFLTDADTFNSDYADRYARALGQGLWGLEANKSEMLWEGWGPASSVYYDKHYSGGWPLALQKKIINQQKIPVGIINAAMSGSTIQEHLANALPITTLIDDGVTIHTNPANYNLREYLLSKLKRAGIANNLKYLLWYQGESDAALKGCSTQYYDLLQSLLTEWQSAFPALKKVFIYQLNNSCMEPAGTGAYAIREAQRQACLNNPIAELIPTSGMSVFHMTPSEVQHDSYRNAPCHLNRYGMAFIGKRTYQILEGFVYKTSLDTPQNYLPNHIISAQLNDENNQLIMEFTYNLDVIETNDAGGPAFLKDYFFDQDYDPIKATDLKIEGNKLVLLLKDKQRLEKVSIYPPAFYLHNKRTYYGPWLKTKGKELTLPYFSDVQIQQSEPENPVFKQLWNSANYTPQANQPFANLNLVIGGQFTSSSSSEALVLYNNSKLQLLQLGSDGWQANISLDYLKQENKGIWVGDFLGDERDEILLLDERLQLYGADSSGITLLWQSTTELASILNPKKMVVGRFQSGIKNELLSINPFVNQSTVYHFTQAVGGQIQLSSETINSSTPSALLENDTRLHCGDFDGDGYSEILSFGAGTNLIALRNSQWYHLWNAGYSNHLSGWGHPIQHDSLQILVGDLDISRPGDELLILGTNQYQSGISVHAFDSKNQNWTDGSTYYSKDLSLGDWPLQTTIGQKTNYVLIPSNMQADRILVLKETVCSGLKKHHTALYDMAIHLNPTSTNSNSINTSWFHVYPNPSSHHIYLESKKPQSETELSIYSLSGALIYQHKERFSPDNFVVDVSYLQNGFYLLKLQSAERSETFKLNIVH